MSDIINHEDCLQYSDDRAGECSGPIVAYYTELGAHIKRCTKHQEVADKVRAQIDHDYPDSDMPPAWFDSANIGEHWGDDY